LACRGAYLHCAAGDAILLGPATPELVATDAIARSLFEHRAIFGIAGVVGAASGTYKAQNYKRSDSQTWQSRHEVTQPAA